MGSSLVPRPSTRLLETFFYSFFFTRVEGLGTRLYGEWSLGMRLSLWGVEPGNEAITMGSGAWE